MPRAVETPRTLQTPHVFAAFLCLYLFTASGGGPFSDALPMWHAAQSLVHHGTFAIDDRWPVNVPAGVGGRYYPVAALLAVLVHVPGALLDAALAAGPTSSSVAITSLLGPVFVGALTPALLFGLLLRLGYARRPAAWATLLAGAGTSVWVYARCPYSEILQAACFTWFLSALLAAGGSLERRAFLRLGFALGLLVNTKNIYAACVPGALAFLWWRHRADRRALPAALAWAALGLAPGLVALGAYNAVRWGSPLRSGYEAVTGGFWRENVLWGLWGPLFSPGKSVFLYAPPLVLGVWGVRRLARPVALAIALTVGPILLIYARYIFWSGDWAWGPRYLVFAMPALAIPIAELVAHGSPRRLLVRVGLPLALALGIAVQVLGCAIRWDDYMTVAGQAQRAWLGRPDRRGTALAPYACFSCFEEVYGTEWLPPMQPIFGHLWLLRHRAAHDDWRTAAADAARAGYTSLTLDIAQGYDARTIDWWLLAVPPGAQRAAAVAMFALLGAVLFRPWRSALRAPEE